MCEGMSCYPVVFSLNTFVAGNGFFARVVSKGQVLVTLEDEGYWVDGVNPAGVSDGSATIKDALEAFRDEYNLVLFDIANEADGFESFREAVHRFFFSKDEEILAKWLAARAAVRESGLSIDGLPKAHGEISPEIQVLLLEPKPSENKLPEERFAEAA